jgi:dephospho-CoA kinase
MLIVGLTGGIGTGKSKVADLLRELGAGVACSDQIVRDIQKAGSEALAEIARRFGEEYILPSGELDRARLGDLIFNDPEARLALNGIIHPRVMRRLSEAIEEFRSEGRAVGVLDIPLLLEGRLAGKGSGAVLPFDLIVVVAASEEAQLERIMARDGLSREDARARIASQMPIEEKCKHADVVIDNSGPWEQTEKQVRELYAAWVSGARSEGRS